MRNPELASLAAYNIICIDSLSVATRLASSV